MPPHPRPEAVNTKMPQMYVLHNKLMIYGIYFIILLPDRRNALLMI